VASPPLIIATRGSPLALAQAKAVLARCQAVAPDQRFELKIIQTTGDKLRTAALAGGSLPKGLFTKELEAALLRGQADLAVHSLKDLPTELPSGLKLGAVTARADVREVLVYRQGSLGPGVVSVGVEPRPGTSGLLKRKSDPQTASPLGQVPGAIQLEFGALSVLPPQATVGTSSTRRTAQLRQRRPDLRIVPVRGNVGTRLLKLVQQPHLDAILLAAAGLERLGYVIRPDGQLQGNDLPPGLAAVFVPVEELLPAVGQGAVGIEIRADDLRLEALCTELNDPVTWRCVTAERAFLAAMGGGCHQAIGAYANVQNGKLHLRAVSFLADRPQAGELWGDLDAPVALGYQLAEQMGRGHPPDETPF